MIDLHFKNAKIINEGQCIEGDLLVLNGRIEGIDKKTAKNVQEIDCKGLYLVPGMIDDQVHFREPGLTHKADIQHESQAAVAGGVTSFMEMPNTIPATLDHQTLAQKYAIAEQTSVANYAFYLGTNNHNIEAIKTLKVGQAAGVKIFMGSSTGHLLVDDDSALEKIFAHAPTIIATHCEDDARIKSHEKLWRQRYGEKVPMAEHPNIRDRQACINSTKKAIELAHKHDTQLHILHISTLEECQLFSKVALAKKNITAEACVHHLSLCDEDYAQSQGLIKCNPAIKTAQDRRAIQQALIEGRIDVVATDHAPHTWAEKQQDYFNVPSGLPLLQETLPLLCEMVHDGLLSLPQLIEKSAHNVAIRYNIINRGFIREGYWADLCLLDMKKPYQIDHKQALSKCGWTPFHGKQLRTSVLSTFVNGHRVYQQGAIDASIKGQKINFGLQR